MSTAPGRLLILQLMAAVAGCEKDDPVPGDSHLPELADPKLGGASPAPGGLPPNPQAAIAACERWLRATCTRIETCLADSSWQPGGAGDGGAGHGPSHSSSDGGQGDALSAAIDECVRSNNAKNGTCEQWAAGNQCAANTAGADMFNRCAQDVEAQACGKVCSASATTGFIWCWKPCLLFCPS